MNHEQINQLNLIDRYLMGKLPAEERAQFEEHFVDCPQCIAQLQTTKLFIRDLRQVAAEQLVAAAASLPEPQPKTPLQVERPAFWRRPLAVALSCLLLALIGGGGLVIYAYRLQREIAQVKSLLAQAERRSEDERQSALATDRMRQETESQLIEQRRALEAKLRDEAAQRAKLAAEINRQMHPVGNTHIFVLSAVRGHEPVTKVNLSGSASLFVLSIPPLEEMPFDRYRVTIFNHRHQRVWQSRRLLPGPDKAISLTFNAKFFKPGQYYLIVGGVNQAGSSATIGHYPFQITQLP